jgi:hypothetical protein
MIRIDNLRFFSAKQFFLYFIFFFHFIHTYNITEGNWPFLKRLYFVFLPLSPEPCSVIKCNSKKTVIKNAIIRTFNHITCCRAGYLIGQNRRFALAVPVHPLAFAAASAVPRSPPNRLPTNRRPAAVSNYPTRRRFGDATRVP